MGSLTIKVTQIFLLTKYFMSHRFHFPLNRILYLISLFRENHGRLEGLSLLKVHDGIGNDDNRITHLNLAGSSTVQTDATTATLTLDDVGFQAFAIIIIYNLNFFFPCS